MSNAVPPIPLTLVDQGLPRPSLRCSFCPVLLPFSLLDGTWCQHLPFSSTPFLLLY